MSWPGRTGRAVRDLIGTKIIGRNCGRKPMSPLRQGKNTPGFVPRGYERFRLYNGQNAAGISLRDMAIRYHAFMSPGAPVQGSSSLLFAASVKVNGKGW